MQTLKAFLTDLRRDDPLSLLAGHYAWPGYPDAFGIDSAIHLADVLEELEPGTVNAHIFLNDIAALTMCSAVECHAGSARSGNLSPRTGNDLEPWIANFLPAVERAAISRHGWLEQAHLLAQFLETVTQNDASHPVLANLQELDGYDGISSWLEDVEVLLYLTSRRFFRPLLLSYETGRSLPQVLFERTITNGASRMLHRIRKSEMRTGLCVSSDDEGRELFWVRDENGNRIELRTETKQREGMRASNKCSAILSHLFFHACKALTRVAEQSSPPSQLSVFYMIPSYDRGRVRDGIKVFFAIYNNFRHWFGVPQVRLTTAFYTHPDRGEMLCEVYSPGSGSGHPSVATHKIATRARHKFRGMPVAGVVGDVCQRIYVDHNATTPLDPRVLEKMMPFMTYAFGNASSAHSFGWDAELAVAEARQQVANLIHASSDEIFFTSGATESNNWFLKECVNRDNAKIITSAFEHKSVLETVRDLTPHDVAVTYLPVDQAGQIDLDAIEADTLRPGTFVSLMSVNNEIHSLLNLTAVGALCRQTGAVFHTDAAQASGKVPINVQSMGIHAMSMSAHKIYGPKGIGALFVSERLQKTLSPLIAGGGQERGMRSGTLATSLIVGFGEACAIAMERMESDAERLYGLSELFLSRLNAQGVSYRLVGPQHVRQRQPGSLALIVNDLEVSKLSELLPEVALSRGSACNSLGSSNHVLKAMGLSPDDESNFIRLSFGRFNDELHALYIADRITEVLAGREARHRRSDAWRMQPD